MYVPEKKKKIQFNEELRRSLPLRKEELSRFIAEAVREKLWGALRGPVGGTSG